MLLNVDQVWCSNCNQGRVMYKTTKEKDGVMPDTKWLFRCGKCGQVLLWAYRCIH